MLTDFGTKQYGVDVETETVSSGLRAYWKVGHPSAFLSRLAVTLVTDLNRCRVGAELDRRRSVGTIDSGCVPESVNFRGVCRNLCFSGGCTGVIREVYRT